MKKRDCFEEKKIGATFFFYNVVNLAIKIVAKVMRNNNFGEFVDFGALLHPWKGQVKTQDRYSCK